MKTFSIQTRSKASEKAKEEREKMSIMENGPNLKRKRRRSATPGSVSQKRKRTSEAPSSTPAAEHPELLNGVPIPPPSPSVDFQGLLNLVQRPQSIVSPAELPVALRHESPLRIHNRSVEEYQQIYHEVVDDMLRYKNGGVRPYSLQLGRIIKQKLWERLDCPTIMTSEDCDRLLHVDMSYGVGVHPPLYDRDVSGEPEPKRPLKRRAN